MKIQQNSPWSVPPVDQWDWTLPIVSLVAALSALRNAGLITIAWLVITAPLWLPALVVLTIHLWAKIRRYRQEV